MLQLTFFFIPSLSVFLYFSISTCDEIHKNFCLRLLRCAFKVQFHECIHMSITAERKWGGKTNVKNGPASHGMRCLEYFRSRYSSWLTIPSNASLPRLLICLHHHHRHQHHQLIKCFDDWKVVVASGRFFFVHIKSIHSIRHYKSNFLISSILIGWWCIFPICTIALQPNCSVNIDFVS